MAIVEFMLTQGIHPSEISLAQRLRKHRTKEGKQPMALCV